MELSKAEKVDQRRQAVWEQHVRGVPANVIGKALGVNISTVYTDIKFFRARHKDEIETADPNTEIGDIVSKYDEIYKSAMHEYAAAQRQQHRASFLEKALMAVSKKAQLLEDTGVLPKAAQEIRGKLVIDGVDTEKASLQELKALRERLVSNLQKIRGN
jgi:hypothetical protein